MKNNKFRRFISLIYAYYLYFIIVRLQFNKVLLSKNNAIFFCGNSTIGDNVFLLSLVKPFSDTHKKKVFYFGKKQYIDMLKSFYVEYKSIIVWKSINNKTFNRIISKEIILKKIIDFCNKHSDRVFHSIFYLKEKIPKATSLLSYQKTKMNINNEDVFVPKLETKNKEKVVVINIESQTVRSQRIESIANQSIRYLNSIGAKVFVNAKESNLLGNYETIFPPLVELVSLIHSSMLFISIRTGLVDLAMCTNTNMIVVWGSDDVDRNSFSIINNWPIDKHRLIYEIDDRDFKIKYLIDALNNL